MDQCKSRVPDPLHQRLNPARFPEMTPLMGAIVGYLLEEAFTDPSIAELTVSPDGGGVAVPLDAAGRRLHPFFVGSVADLRASIRRLGIAAKVDDAQWQELAERVRSRIGIDLEPGAEAGARPD